MRQQRRHIILGSLLLAMAGRAAMAAGPFAGRRVLHVDSYHQGNEWNDRIAAAVRDTLAGSGVELRVVHLDTKRRPAEPEILAAVGQVRELIAAFRPDVVTTSDDPAARYLITAYRGSDLPFVFCGLNWDAASYGLPYPNVTGMVEVSPIPQIVRLLRAYARGGRIGFIAEDTDTKRKEVEYHARLFRIAYDQVYLVRTFADWQAAFARAQDEVDMLMVLGVGAVAGWDDAAARDWAEATTRIPTGTDFGWLMHVAMLGVGKLPEEQGRWAAHAALEILGGTAPSAIPIAYNKEGQLYFNPRIAAKVGVTEVPPLAQLVP